jgi:hypothetical protein
MFNNDIDLIITDALFKEIVIVLLIREIYYIYI